MLIHFLWFCFPSQASVSSKVLCQVNYSSHALKILRSRSYGENQVSAKLVFFEMFRLPCTSRCFWRFKNYFKGSHSTTCCSLHPRAFCKMKDCYYSFFSLKCYDFRLFYPQKLMCPLLQAVHNKARSWEIWPFQWPMGSGSHLDKATLATLSQPCFVN